MTNTLARNSLSALILLASVANVSVNRGQEENASDKNQRLYVIADGAIANYEAFHAYSSDVELAYGQCESIEQALDAGPVASVSRGAAKHLVDGERVFYHRTTSEEPRIAPSGYSMIITPVGIIHDGKQTLDVSYVAFGGTLKPEFSGVDFTTWNGAGIIRVGDDSVFGSYLASALQQGRATIEEKPAQSLGDRSVTPVHYRFDAMEIRWLIDEERGYLPLETTVSFGGQLFATAYVTDVKNVEGVGWFPMRCVRASPTANADAFDVLEVNVESLKIGPPDATEFALDVPAGTAIHDAQNNNSQFVLAEPETFDIEDFADIQKRAERRAAEREGRSTSSLSLSTWALLLLGAILVIGAVVVLARGRSTSKRG